MIILYASKTGNVRRFINKLEGLRCIDIKEIENINEPFVLITYTTGFGKVPNEVEEFLSSNSNHLVAVASSGNLNWGKNFGKSANTISEKYNVPIILKFELSGLKGDVVKFQERVNKLNG